MILADTEISRLMLRGAIRITPFDGALLQPASYDLRLGSCLRIMNRRVRYVDPADVPDDLFVPVKGEGECVILHPGRFVLASTVESVTLHPSVAAQVCGKSTLGRLGLTIHQTAGFVDPGFGGQITLEIKNEGDAAILLRPGMRIAQVAFFAIHGEVARPYGHPDLGSHYQGQTGPTTPESVS